MAETILFKTCPCCKINLPLSAFTKLVTSPDGVDRYCRVCQAMKRRRRLLEGPKTATGRPVLQPVLPFADMNEETARLCLKCGVYRPLSDFTSEKGRKDGRRRYCRACMKTYLSNWKKANPERYAEVHRLWRERNYFKYVIGHIRSRCKKKGIPYDLDNHIPNLKARWDAGVCEMSGVPFDYTKKKEPNSPSFDRIVPVTGYLFANVRIVCYALNASMGNWGEVKTLEIMRAWIARVDASAAAS